MNLDESTSRNKPRWPVEIWLSILSYLDTKDLKSLTLTSSSHRKLAIKFLFSSISLRFGLWRSEYDELEGSTDDSLFEHSKRSLAILLRLAEDAIIASAVVSLTVYTFLDTRFPFAFETYHIETILPKLTRLRTFRWIGEYPPFPSQIARRLTMHPRIRGLLLNGLDDDTAQILCGLDKLHALDLIDPNQHSGEWDPNVLLKPESLDALLNSGLKHLHELSIPGYLASQVNILRLADTLTRLTICVAGDCIGLDLFLRQAYALVSLSVVDCKDFAFLVDVSLSDRLPILRELKLSLALPLVRDVARDDRPRNFLVEAQQLSSFLSTHDDIRRFDFAVEPVNNFPRLASALDSFDNVEWFSIILNAVCKLQRASAIGLSVPKLPMQNLRDIVKKLTNLPTTCVAVRLTGLAEISCHSLIEGVFSNMPNLSFLCLSNWRPLEHIHEWVPLPDVSDLLRLLPNLRLVCHNNIFYDLHPDDLETADFFSWLGVKVRFRTIEDFPSEDAYWLMSYRFITKDFISGPDDVGFDEEADDGLVL